MSKIIAFFKSVKWLAWLILGIVVVGIIWIIRGFFVVNSKNPTKLPEVPQKLKEKVEKAEEAALEARVRAKVEAEQAVKILNEAAQIEDGKTRRKKLAELLHTI